MKKMKKIFLFATGVILLGSAFTSCKKKDKPETVAQKLQHNWIVVNVITNYHDASGDNIENIPGTSADFINFNANGTVTSHFDGSDDNGTYAVISDTQVSINGQTYTIKTISSTQLVLYAKEGTATQYDEITINLKR